MAGYGKYRTRQTIRVVAPYNLCFNTFFYRLSAVQSSIYHHTQPLNSTLSTYTAKTVTYGSYGQVTPLPSNFHHTTLSFINFVFYFSINQNMITNIINIVYAIHSFSQESTKLNPEMQLKMAKHELRVNTL